MWALAFLALAYFHSTKNEVFHWGFLQDMWPNMPFRADLVKFTEEIFNGKLHFLCSICLGFSDEFWGAFSVECKEFFWSLLWFPKIYFGICCVFHFDSDFSEGPLISGIVLPFLRLLIALVTPSGLHFLIEFPWIL